MRSPGRYNCPPHGIARPVVRHRCRQPFGKRLRSARPHGEPGGAGPTTRSGRLFLREPVPSAAVSSQVRPSDGTISGGDRHGGGGIAPNAPADGRSAVPVADRSGTRRRYPARRSATRIGSDFPNRGDREDFSILPGWIFDRRLVRSRNSAATAVHETCAGSVAPNASLRPRTAPALSEPEPAAPARRPLDPERNRTSETGHANSADGTFARPKPASRRHRTDL